MRVKTYPSWDGIDGAIGVISFLKAMSSISSSGLTDVRGHERRFPMSVVFPTWRLPRRWQLPKGLSFLFFLSFSVLFRIVVAHVDVPIRPGRVRGGSGQCPNPTERSVGCGGPCRCPNPTGWSVGCGGLDRGPNPISQSRVSSG